MTGYALEVKLIKWKCRCKSHPSGSCDDPKSNKSESLREAYLGNFGYKVRNLSDALRKWDRWLHDEVKG